MGLALMAAGCDNPAATIAVSQAEAPASSLASEFPAANAPAETQEVQQLANRWTEAYNANDAAALGALYTEDARLYLHGHPTVSARQRIQEYWAEDMKVDSPLTVLTVTHAVNGIDMKLVHGNYQVINRQTGAPLGHGRFAHIWTKAGDGAWQLDRDLWNQPYE
jgi:uncharacterized protein (TIGR02246 family)